jgi:hypothetical protein
VTEPITLRRQLKSRAQHRELHARQRYLNPRSETIVHRPPAER